jgi:uncharacterized protein YndB with AHSA1/START domain
MKRRGEPTILHFRRVMAAPPARVFALWTEPESIKKWFGGPAVEVGKVVLDLRPGGAYSIAVRGEDGDAVISGRFLAVEAPARLVYTWTLEGEMGATPETTVRVEFRAHREGTELLLEHAPFDEPQVRTLHEAGWETCFKALDAMLKLVETARP